MAQGVRRLTPAGLPCQPPQDELSEVRIASVRWALRGRMAHRTEAMLRSGGLPGEGHLIVRQVVELMHRLVYLAIRGVYLY